MKEVQCYCMEQAREESMDATKVEATLRQAPCKHQNRFIEFFLLHQWRARSPFFVLNTTCRFHGRHIFFASRPRNVEIKWRQTQKRESGARRKQNLVHFPLKCQTPTRRRTKNSHVAPTENQELQSTNPRSLLHSIVRSYERLCTPASFGLGW